MSEVLRNEEEVCRFIISELEKRLVPPLSPDKREHHLVKLIVGVKERTGVTAAANLAPGQTNGSR